MADKASFHDSWIYRSARMLCPTCMYYVPKSAADGTTPLGRCRRHAPTMSGFPVMFPTDWCGDHKLNENTIETQVEIGKPGDLQ